MVRSCGIIPSVQAVACARPPELAELAFTFSAAGRRNRASLTLHAAHGGDVLGLGLLVLVCCGRLVVAAGCRGAVGTGGRHRRVFGFQRRRQQRCGSRETEGRLEGSLTAASAPLKDPLLAPAGALRRGSAVKCALSLGATLKAARCGDKNKHPAKRSYDPQSADRLTLQHPQAPGPDRMFSTGPFTIKGRFSIPSSWTCVGFF